MIEGLDNFTRAQWDGKGMQTPFIFSMNVCGTFRHSSANVTSFFLPLNPEIHGKRRRHGRYPTTGCQATTLSAHSGMPLTHVNTELDENTAISPLRTERCFICIHLLQVKGVHYPLPKLLLPPLSAHLRPTTQLTKKERRSRQYREIVPPATVRAARTYSTRTLLPR